MVVDELPLIFLFNKDGSNTQFHVLSSSIWEGPFFHVIFRQNRSVPINLDIRMEPLWFCPITRCNPFLVALHSLKYYWVCRTDTCQ